MKPGQCKTTGESGCYYAILNSTDTSDIADNNNIDGPAFVTVRTGQYFQTSGCADGCFSDSRSAEGSADVARASSAGTCPGDPGLPDAVRR